MRQFRLENIKLCAFETQRPRHVATGCLHLDGEHLQRTYASILHLNIEVVERIELRARSPQPQPFHICHILEIRHPGGGTVQHARARQCLLQLYDGRANLRALVGAVLVIFRLVALIKH